MFPRKLRAEIGAAALCAGKRDVYATHSTHAAAAIPAFYGEEGAFMPGIVLDIPSENTIYRPFGRAVWHF